MRQALEAMLIATFSIVLTVLIMAAVFPRHALGGADRALETPDIQPAVFVHGIHLRPGTAATPDAPRSIDRAPGSGCPYLAALAAASGCPALKGRCPALTPRAAASACPYLEGLRRQAPETTKRPVGRRGLDI